MKSEFERIKEFADMHKNARLKANRSQEYMSLCLGITKKTVSNWEKGISQPTFFQSLEWFRCLNTNPFPYYLSFCFPDATKEDHEVRKEFDELCKTLPDNIKEALLFIFLGEHGSSPTALIQLVLAHLQTPLKARIIQASLIASVFELEHDLHGLTCPDDIMPDMNLLNDTLEKAKIAALNHESKYSV